MLYTLNWKHKTRKALPLRLASKLAFKDVSLLEDRLFILQCNGRFINAMAVLSTQKQPDGQTSRFQRQIAFSLLWPVYQREAQWPFYQPDGQTSRLQRHIAFSLLSRTISLSAAGPSYSQQENGRFINARPSGRFIKAEATGWPDLQISATNCIFAIFPHDQLISGRAKLFSAKAGPMAVLSTRGPTAVLSV